MTDLSPQFLNADEVATVLHLAVKTVRNRGSSAPPGTLWAPCRPGRWHRQQVEILEAIDANATTKETGEHLWTMAKERMAEALSPRTESKDGTRRRLRRESSSTLKRQGGKSRGS